MKLSAPRGKSRRDVTDRPDVRSGRSVTPSLLRLEPRAARSALDAALGHSEGYSYFCSASITARGAHGGYYVVVGPAGGHPGRCLPGRARHLLGHSRTARSVIVHEEPDAVAAQDRLLWERWQGRVRRGGAGSRRPESLFAQVLMGHGDEAVRAYFAAMSPARCTLQIPTEVLFR
jgi:hypothetical protein